LSVIVILSLSKLIHASKNDLSAVVSVLEISVFSSTVWFFLTVELSTTETFSTSVCLKSVVLFLVLQPNNNKAASVISKQTIKSILIIFISFFIIKKYLYI